MARLPLYQIPGVRSPLAIPEQFASGLTPMVNRSGPADFGNARMPNFNPAEPGRLTQLRGVAGEGAGGAGQQEGSEIPIEDPETGEIIWRTPWQVGENGQPEPKPATVKATTPFADPNAGGSAPNAPELDPKPGITETKPEAEKTLPKTAKVRVDEEGAGPQRGGGGYRLIRGGLRTESIIRKPGLGLSPEDVEEIEGRPKYFSPLDAVYAGETRAQAMELERQDNEALILQQQQDIEKEKSRRMAIDRMLQEKKSIADGRLARAQAEQPKTFSQVWEDRGTLSGILSALAIGLSGAANPHGENQAWRMMKETVENEVAGQQQRYENLRQKSEDADNDYSKAIALYGTPEAARTDLQMRYYANASALARNKASQADQEIVRDTYSQYADQLQQQADALKLQLHATLHGQILQENIKNVPDQVIGPPKAKPGKRVRLPNGDYGYVQDEITMREIQKKFTGLRGLRQGIERAKELSQEAMKLAPSDRKAALESIHSMLELKIAVSHEQGAISEQEGERYEKMLGSATNWTGTGTARLDELEKGVDADISNYAQDYVYQDPEATIPYEGSSGSGFDEQAVQ